MSSRRGLIALAGIAGLLALALIVDVARSGGPPADRRLVPEATESSILSVTISIPGQPAIEIASRERGELSITAPVQVPMAQAAAADLIGTLQLVAYRRHVADRATEPTRATLVIRTVTGGLVELAVGDEIAATGQAWMARAGRRGSFLVDGHSARVLARDLVQLRAREVVSDEIGRAARIALTAGDASVTAIDGGWLVDIGRGGPVRMDPDARTTLLDLLRRLRFEQFAAASGGAPGGLSIEITGDVRTQVITEHGECPGNPSRRLVRSPIGDGCVDPEIVAELAELARRGEALWDRRLFVDARAGDVTLTTGAGSVRGAGDSEPTRRWLARVAELATGTWIDRPGEPPIGSIELSRPGSEGDRVDLYRAPNGKTAAARAGEAVAVVLAEPADDLLSPSSYRFRSLAIVSRDPIEVRSIAVADRGRAVAEVERGELIGEWNSRRPAGAALDVDAISEIAAELAQLSASQFVAARPEPRHGLATARRTLTFELDPPPTGGSPERHTLAIGANARDGCYATLSGDDLVFTLTRAVCDVLRAPMSTR